MPRSLMVSVDADSQGMRLDAFLAKVGCYASRSNAAKHIEAEKVFLNGKVASKKTSVSEGDTVVYEEAEEVSRIPILGEPIDLDIRYEDPYMMVVSKQAGLCVHPSEGHYGTTLVNGLIYKYGRENLAHVQGDDRPGIVHRLDMETSGLMMCAKDDETGNRLQDMIRLRTVDRRYLTLVHGNIAHDTGMIDEPIARSEGNRLRMAVSDRPGARSAVTTFKVLERFEAGRFDEGYSLLECKLYTGRTHQIRVHMKHIHHCCVGDPMYRSGSEKAQMGLKRQFLHSYSLEFEHPVYGEIVSLVDALPPELQNVLDSLADRSMGRTPMGELVFEELKYAQRQPEWLSMM